MGNYIYYGLGCAFGTRDQKDPKSDKFRNDGDCDNSWLFIIGYTISLFVIQLNLNSIMHHKYTRHAQIIYSLMVPITLFAFLLASLSIMKEDIKQNNNLATVFDVVGLAMVGIGVFIYNIFKEKPQKASILDE